MHFVVLCSALNKCIVSKSSIIEAEAVIEFFCSYCNLETMNTTTRKFIVTVFRFAQRVRELSATVESRERSLLELSREHSRLRELCDHLEQQIQPSGQDAAQVERAYAQKLAELERRLNTANKVRDSLSLTLLLTHSLTLSLFL